MRLIFLAAGAMTFSCACSAADGVVVPWCPLTPSPQEKPADPPGPCRPFAQILEEVKKKALAAERRDEEEVRAMRSLVGRTLADDEPQTRPQPHGNAQPVAAVAAPSEEDSTEETEEDGAAKPANPLPVHVAVLPPRRPRDGEEAKRLEAQKAILLAEARRRTRLAEAKKAAELRKARNSD